MLIVLGGRRGETRQASGQTHFTLCQLSDGFVCCYLGQVHFGERSLRVPKKCSTGLDSL